MYLSNVGGCLLYHVSRLTSPISSLLSHLFCLTSPVSLLLSHLGGLRKFSFREFRNIFNFVVREISLEFAKNKIEIFEISRNTISKFGQIFVILPKRNYFFLIFLYKNLKIVYLWDTLFIKCKWILIIFHQ